MYSRQKVVDYANSQIGKKESDGSYKSIIDTYNTLPADQLPRKTRMSYGWAWCACFWSAVAVALKYLAIMPIEISCFYLIEAAKKLKAWVENPVRNESPVLRILQRVRRREMALYSIHDGRHTVHGIFVRRISETGIKRARIRRKKGRRGAASP